jgi:hypothetical protein
VNEMRSDDDGHEVFISNTQESWEVQLYILSLIYILYIIYYIILYIIITHHVYHSLEMSMWEQRKSTADSSS